MNTVNLNQINQRIMNDPQRVVDEEEINFNKRVAELCEAVPESGLILLSGPSCSGKTTLSLKMKEFFENGHHVAYSLGLDNFFVNRKESIFLPNGKKDYESPNSLCLPLLADTLGSLAEGRETPIPQYDFISGVRKDDAWRITRKNGDVVIIEGLHALSPEIARKIQGMVLKVYANVARDFVFESGETVVWQDVRFLRRLVRDGKYRGYSPLVVCKMWDDVLEGEKKYIIPYAISADCILDTSFDYELNHIAPFAFPLLKQLNRDAVYGEKAIRLQNALNKLVSLQNAVLPGNSLLREFTGGSAFADENGSK